MAAVRRQFAELRRLCLVFAPGEDDLRILLRHVVEPDVEVDADVARERQGVADEVYERRIRGEEARRDRDVGGGHRELVVLHRESGVVAVRDREAAQPVAAFGRDREGDARSCGGGVLTCRDAAVLHARDRDAVGAVGKGRHHDQIRGGHRELVLRDRIGVVGEVVNGQALQRAALGGRDGEDDLVSNVRGTLVDRHGAVARRQDGDRVVDGGEARCDGDVGGGHNEGVLRCEVDRLPFPVGDGVAAEAVARCGLRRQGDRVAHMRGFGAGARGAARHAGDLDAVVFLYKGRLDRDVAGGHHEGVRRDERNGLIICVGDAIALQDVARCGAVRQRDRVADVGARGIAADGHGAVFRRGDGHRVVDRRGDQRIGVGPVIEDHRRGVGRLRGQFLRRDGRFHYFLMTADGTGEGRGGFGAGPRPGRRAVGVVHVGEDRFHGDVVVRHFEGIVLRNIDLGLLAVVGVQAAEDPAVVRLHVQRDGRAGYGDFLVGNDRASAGDIHRDRVAVAVEGSRQIDVRRRHHEAGAGERVRGGIAVVGVVEVDAVRAVALVRSDPEVDRTAGKRSAVRMVEQLQSAVFHALVHFDIVVDLRRDAHDPRGIAAAVLDVVIAGRPTVVHRLDHVDVARQDLRVVLRVDGVAAAHVAACEDGDVVLRYQVGGRSDGHCARQDRRVRNGRVVARRVIGG